ncbi:hypothetical protein U9M48_044242 [Paspalum notatum var. saurae]|uniref:PWWP domain-containing protein n=1 Tax=Paspalum notatum var. saurae TaxID=547442 RepID=A0AAQ3UZ86_PASNO
MSSGAVAASDPGGGESKLVASADVAMTEAAGDAAAPAAQVKVEGRVALAMDAPVPLEEGDSAVSDPLYATESAGMVGAEGPEEPVQGAEGLNGPLQTEAEAKPVPVQDVAAAVQEVEAEGSAASQHAEAECNELEGNHVSAEPGTENNEFDNDHEGDREPSADQLNDGSEMLLQTGEQFSESGNDPSSSEEAAILGQGARYCLPPLDKGGFQVADLVWGKVKSHPWWPGEIFDPSDASELALKHQKKGSHLVAYFGDNTFAWCDESQLKPFVTNYSQMEKQSSSDAFVGSVNNALEELSRRILSGMSCSCLPDELADNGMSYTVDNAGLKDGVTCSAVNRPEILKCFNPENLLHYIKDLALFPGQGGDLLELVIACSQLTSFYRSKGCPELASFQTGDAWVEEGLDDMDASSAQNEMVEEVVINEVQPTQDKPKRGRGRPRKHKPVDDQVVTVKRDTSNQANGTSYDEKQGVMNLDDFDNLQNKKKRIFDSFEDSDKSSAPTGGSSFKIGECIRRAASQLTGSSSIVKAQNETTAYKNAAEAENGEFDISSDDAVDELTLEKRAKRRRLHRNHTADPKELLAQLCMVATEPMNGYSFSAMIISYFNDYRNYIVSTTTEANIIEKSTSRRGRKRKEVLPSPEVETTDHMQDSYWSGLSLHNHPIHDLRKESPTTRPRRRRRSSRHTAAPLLELSDLVPKKQIQVVERSIIHVDEKMVDELKPTALVLSFGRSAALPSELDLIKMFNRYGPLKETDTEVHKDTNTVKVVFKKRADAERAFSVAGKYGTFGPSLRSYRLVNMPFSLKTLSANNPVKCPADCSTEIAGSTKSEAPKEAMEVDQVCKTEKVEVAGEQTVEQVQTVKQTSQAEAADTAFVNEVDMVEKTVKVDAGHVNQIGTAAQGASAAEGSFEQVSNVDEAYTQKEASIGGLPKVTQSGAVTGASVGMADEIQLFDAPNQASIDNKPSFQVAAASEAEPLHSGAAIKESPRDVSDNMQIDVLTETLEQSHISGDNAVFEAVTEAPSTPQVHPEIHAANKVPEEHMVSAELQSQTPDEKLVAQDATEQKLGSEDSKFEAEAFAAEPVVQSTVEQVEVKVVSKTPVEVSGEQVDSIEKTVQVEAITEASGGQLEVGRQTPEDESMAHATAKHSTVMIEKTVESKVVLVEENMENNVAGRVVEEAAESETKEEAPHEKGEIENKADAETLAGETKEGEIAVEAPDEETENKAIAEPIAEKTAEGETKTGTLVEEARPAEETVEEVKTLEDKTTSAEEPVEDAVVVTADEKTTTVAKAVEDAMVEAPDEKMTTAEKTLEDDVAGPPDEKMTTTEKIVEDDMVEPPNTKTTDAEKIAEDATVKSLDEKATAAQKTIEDTTVQASDKQAGASE